MITYERWREVYLVKYRGAIYVNYNSQKLLFPHNACTASEVCVALAPPPPPSATLPSPHAGTAAGRISSEGTCPVTGSIMQTTL